MQASRGPRAFVRILAVRLDAGLLSFGRFDVGRRPLGRRHGLAACGNCLKASRLWLGPRGADHMECRAMT